MTALPSDQELERDELTRRLVASVRDYAIFLLDVSGRVATWNAGAQQIKGYREDEILGKHFSVFRTLEDMRAGKCEQELAVAARDGRFEEEGWRVRKDGSRFWASVIITPVRDDAGALVGYAKVTRDLTDRTRATAAEERFRLLVDSVTDYAIFVLDAGGHVATWNPGAERLKGYREEEILGRHFSIFRTADEVRAGKCEQELTIAARDGRFEEEGWRVRKDGSRFWANVVLSAMRDERGALVGFAKVTRDLTERRRAEEERAALFAAQEANRAKDEFLAMLGHELRNPLAPIVTALHLVRQRSELAGSRELDIIERQVKHMTALVDELLDVSRISSGKIELHERPVDVRDVLARAIESVTPLVEQRHHQLELDAPAFPVVVHGDEGRLTQVFVNLLTNAAKYTDPGGHIRVAMHVDAGHVDVEIHDDGVGIPPDLLPHVFELFVQGRQDLARSAGGLGVGLSLVRSLVEAHGGQVRAESAGPGKGSTFGVRLALVAPEAPDDAARRPSRLGERGAGRRVLLVDDNHDALEILAEALQLAGHVVTAVSDPFEALEVARRTRPEVAILDIGLPGLDGYQLAERLRRELTPVPLLVALTGYGQASDRERAASAGFDAHFVKPADLARLLARIAPT